MRKSNITFFLFLLLTLYSTPSQGIKCFKCAKRIVSSSNNEDAQVPFEESDIDCDDFRKAEDEEKKLKFSMDCTIACEQTLIKGFLFQFKETLFQMDIEHYRCYNPVVDNEKTSVGMGTCFDNGNERTCICNNEDYCLVDKQLSLDDFTPKSAEEDASSGSGLDCKSGCSSGDSSGSGQDGHAEEKEFIEKNSSEEDSNSGDGIYYGNFILSFISILVISFRI